jgi:hypothetical protein
MSHKHPRGHQAEIQPKPSQFHGKRLPPDPQRQTGGLPNRDKLPEGIYRTGVGNEKYTTDVDPAKKIEVCDSWVS